LDRVDDDFQRINESTLIAESRLAELRSLPKTTFDFRKLVWLCEEINSAYGSQCYGWDRSLSDSNTMYFGELIAEDLVDGKSVKRLSATANSECFMAIISSINVRHFQVFSRHSTARFGKRWSGLVSPVN
jgi:hypothetical protein